MRILPIVALGLLSLPAVADNLQGFYAGGNLNFIDADVADGQNDDTSFRSLEIHGGYKYNSWLGGEARVGFGISDESYAMDSSVDPVILEVGIDHYESLYYRAESANTVAKLYGLLGFSNVQTSSDNGTTSESSSDNGLSYGAGVSFVMNEYANLNFEYRVLLSKDDYDFSLFSIGFDYRF